MKAFQRHLYTGYRYMHLWPKRPELALRFHDVRAANLSRHALRHMPWLAVLTLVLGYGYARPEFLPHMVAVALMMLSLPVQGLLWLGQRALQVLEPGDRHWYRQLRQRMAEQGIDAPTTTGPATYWDLAELVDQAFKRTDRAFG